jgi:transcriptional regulator with XRE-family HTH domain
VSVGIGAKLRTIRQHLQLSLREVEERSLGFAQEQVDLSYQVSASWLVRLERKDHELTVNKLIAFASIYNIPTEELLRSIYPRSPQPILRQLSTPNVTMLLTEGPLEEQAKYMLTEPPDGDQLPDETVLLPIGGGLSQAPYRRGIIGKRDRTLEPMIPPGTIVHIDTQKRSISLRKDYANSDKIRASPSPLGESFVSEQEALAEARRRWGNKATVHTAPIPFVKTILFCRVGTGKRWFLAELLGEVKTVKGAGLTWEAAFADADREAALGLSPAGFCY